MNLVRPTFDQEQALWQQGIYHIAGVDEVGRGALAGPVVAAAVIVPPFCNLTDVWAEVRDSKQLSANQRQKLEAAIQHQALAWGIGSVEASRIDQIGIAEATRRAMLEALNKLAVRPDYLLIDWVKLPESGLAQQSMPKADTHIASVAAASILAKVYRDRLMTELDQHYPVYGFARHKGYGSAAHLAALAAYGPSPIHRRSFAPLLQLKLF